MLLLWILSLFLETVAGGEVCFDRLGCFSDNKPWAGTSERPLKGLPWDPSAINVRFLLYTNENPNNYQRITADSSVIRSSNFKTDRKTRFIIHGFIDKGEENWLADLCKALFQVESVNCICVDWRGGSRTLYSQASQNIQVVGAEVAYLINFLQSQLDYPPSSVHIIGHSLGSHAAGEAGRRTNGAIGRITGFWFYTVDQTVGHLDFFPNGGLQMPGCQKNILSQIVDIDGIWEGTRDFAACNHLRSYKYYIDSITNPKGFAGFSCDSYSSFSSNKCFPCATGECPQMGHYADKFPGKTKENFQKFYLNTGDKSNFSRWRYRIAVTLSGQKVTGHVLVSLFGNAGNTKQYEIYRGSLKPGNNHSNEIDSDVDVGDLQKVKFIWYNNVINITLPKVGASRITVTRSDGRVFDFCSQDTVREEVLLTLQPC
uniref:Triacylglycerol lipase n=1 Tax=Cavia porcellus TaxID=10141 RepID=H0VNP7_CAVPO